MFKLKVFKGPFCGHICELMDTRFDEIVAVGYGYLIGQAIEDARAKTKAILNDQDKYLSGPLSYDLHLLAEVEKKLGCGGKIISPR